MALCSHLANMMADPAHKFASLNCPSCGDTIVGSAPFADHISTAHDLDGETMKDEPAPSSRLVESVSDEQKMHGCDVCDRSFKKPSDLARHKRIHTGEKPFTCTVCERSFRVKSTLYQHMKIHEERGERMRESCTLCGKRYCSKSSLKQHLAVVHAQHRPIKCTVDVCDEHFDTVRNRDVHMQRCHRSVDVPNGRGAESSRAEGANLGTGWSESRGMVEGGGAEHRDRREQFLQTAQQLTASTKHQPAIEPSFNSAFSRPTNESECNTATNVALRLSPSARSGNVDVHIGVVSGIPPEDRSIVIEMAMLRQLSSSGVLLKIPLSLPFLPPASSLAVDARRMLILISKLQSASLTVPLNVSTEVTDCPVAVFGALPVPEEITVAPAGFVPSCHVCAQYFMSAEESEAHFASEDHETAELLSMSHPNEHVVGSTLNAPIQQYPTMVAKSMPSEVCKLCLGQFDTQESLLAHIRRVHERDNMTDILARRDLFARRRTLN